MRTGGSDSRRGAFPLRARSTRRTFVCMTTALCLLAAGPMTRIETNANADARARSPQPRPRRSSTRRIDAPLSAEVLHNAVDAAMATWQSARADADFSGVTFAIDDLPGDLLGEAQGDVVRVDATRRGLRLVGDVSRQRAAAHGSGHGVAARARACARARALARRRADVRVARGRRAAHGAACSACTDPPQPDAPAPDAPSPEPPAPDAPAPDAPAS